MTNRTGFIGVGAIASAIVRGLRAGWPDLPMSLSPRSAETSQALAANDPLIRREASNAAVVEASTTVILSVLPAQIDVVRGLPFRADQIVVSCVAGTPLSEVEALVAPARVCRLVPLPMIARREGPILLYPALPEIRRMFQNMGDLIVPEDETVFTIFLAGSAFMSSFLALEGAVASWMASRGASPGNASTYVRSLFHALSETALRAEAVDISDLISGHETLGGLNERVRLFLSAKQWFTSPGQAFGSLL